MTQHDSEAVDLVLVGAGIMSATLAVLLKELDPNIRLEIVELQESGAVESSNPWNNAGTGHAGLCELNYTPDSKDGSIDIKKAVTINTQFEVSELRAGRQEHRLPQTPFQCAENPSRL